MLSVPKEIGTDVYINRGMVQAFYVVKHAHLRHCFAYLSAVFYEVYPRQY